jgi:peptidoglycan/LPS O-acetylase OafA/YrhL
MKLIEKKRYRKDIDGLRAFAVLSVLIFHLGFLPKGFLGVDVFFLISGYLITDILYREISEDTYSVKDFYIRRVRRILPLVSFICFISLLLGILLMLPDDLENLAQSVIATNFFGNNVLQILTTKDYWDVVNEYKPLMHTWSLAVEEQYYFLYPIIFSLFGKHRKNWILPIIIFLTVCSLVVYFLPFEEYLKFYLLPFRFFEMSIGGIAAIYLKGRIIETRLSPLVILMVIGMMIWDIPFLPSDWQLIATVVLTCFLLCIDHSKNLISAALLQNSVVVFIGKISFSLYMWHQLLFAFGRYAFFETIGLEESLLLLMLTFILSITSYFLIEQPFRNKNKFSNKFVISTLIIFFLVTSGLSGYIYVKAGVLKDIPELGIEKNNASRGMHSAYNHRNYKLNQPFKSNKIKVLVIGDSFARDWINVLKESKYDSLIEVSYIDNPRSNKNLRRISESADIIFYTNMLLSIIRYQELKLDESKLWVVGIKNFGMSSGYFYNYKGDDYCEQTTAMAEGYTDKNKELSSFFGKKYIDLIKLVSDKETQQMPVFTNDCKFISQDCRHLTKSGAIYFADKINLLKNFPLDLVNRKF